MDKLETIKVFIEVAKHQSFVSASEQLGLSAPATTRAIAALETRLGVKLFNRTTRHVRLTEPGSRYLQDAKGIIEQLEEAEAAVAGVYTQPKGILRVTAPVLFGEKHIMPIVTEYLGIHHNVSVRTLLYDRLASMLEEEVDIAIRIGHLKDSSMYATHVGNVRRLVCGSPRYFEKHGIPSTPSDLADHNIIFPAPIEGENTWQFQKNGKKETVKLNPKLSCNQNTAALNATVQGLGITRLMSYQISEELDKGNLQCVLMDYDEEPLPVNVIHLEGRRANAKIRSFLDLAIERLRENPAIH